MRVYLQDLPFDAVSPSFYQFAPELLAGHSIDVAYLGDAEVSDLPQWCLFHGDPQGGISCQMFASRDDAVAFLRDGLAPPVVLR